MIRTCRKIDQLILWFCSAEFLWLVSFCLIRWFWPIPFVWQIVNVVVSLCEFPSCKLTFIRWRILFCWVIVGVEIFTLPICAHESSSFLKIGCEVNVFFLAKNFCFNPRSSLRPLVQNLFSLLISSFLLQFSILMLKPDWFKFLFNYIVGGIVMKVRRTTFKPVLSLELNWLLTTCCLIRSVKCFKWFCSYCLFWLIKGRNIRSTCHCLVICKSSARHVKRISNMCKDKTCLVWLTWLK